MKLDRWIGPTTTIGRHLERLEDRRHLATDVGVSLASSPVIADGGEVVSDEFEVANLGTAPATVDNVANQDGVQDMAWNRESRFADFHTRTLRVGGALGFGFGFHGSQNEEVLGSSVHDAGDVNGDGLNDVIFGSVGLFRDLSVSNDFICGTYVVFGSRETPAPNRETVWRPVSCGLPCPTAWLS